MATCMHGYPPGGCLICATLGSEVTQPRVGNDPAVAPLERVRGPEGRRRREPADPISGMGEGRRPVHRWPAVSLALVAVGVVALVAAGWIVVGVVYAAVRVIEVVAVAGAAGWIGFRVGHWRGRHGH